MWPTPNEIAEGLAKMLRQDIAPALADDHTRTQLHQIVGVLRQVDWDGAGDGLRAADRALGELLADGARWIAQDSSRAGHFSAIELGPTAEDRGLALAEVVAAHRERRQALEQLVTELARWRGRHPADGPAEALWDRIGAHLAGEAAAGA